MVVRGVTGQLSPGIAVLRGGKRTSLLTIDSVHAGHAGNYSCTARNKAASSEFSAALVVNGSEMFKNSYSSK